MNLYVKLSSLLLVTTMMLIPLAEAHDKKHEKVKYVQGGACKPGNGSKKHPFSTLQEAEADQANWNVLIVLSSTFPLDGGITLTDGQKLIGEENPTDISLSPTQPIITNTMLGSNGGNGVIVNGTVTIENIYFKDTYASAIQYDNAQDLTVKNVLVTGYGQGVNNAAGISGNCPNSGKTHISKVIIRDSANGNIGSGIRDNVQAGAHRELLICNSEIASSNLDGIDSLSDGMDATSCVTIKDVYIHDLTSEEAFGVHCQSANGAQLSALIKDSLFNAAGLIHVFGGATSGDTRLKLKVEGCTFEDTRDEVIAVQILNNAGAPTTEMIVEDSIIKFEGIGCRAFFSSSQTGTQTIRLIDNKATLGLDGIFYLAQSTSNLAKTTDAVMKDNFFTGSTAINILASSGPWTTLTIDALHNCFQGDDTAAAFLSQGASAVNATIHAHKNSISGFNPDIWENFANVYYDVTKNWWGHAVNPPCNPGVCPQPQFQTCIGGICQGPVVQGTTNVDASDPLTHSIKCPHNCCQPLPTPQP